MILVRTNYDRETSITHSWAEKLRESLPHHADLSAHNADSDSLRTALREEGVSPYIAFYGHGEPHRLIGQSQTSLISETEGIIPAELNGRKLYAVACNAGSELGRALSTAGCFFMGYEEPFLIGHGYESEFGEIVNEGFLQWARGNKPQAVVESIRTAWLDMAESLRTNTSNRKIEVGYRTDAGSSALYNARYVCFHDVKDPQD